MAWEIEDAPIVSPHSFATVILTTCLSTVGGSNLIGAVLPVDSSRYEDKEEDNPRLDKLHQLRLRIGQDGIE